MIDISTLKNSRLLSQADLVSLEWLYKYGNADQEGKLLSLLTLFFYHLSQSQIGLPMDQGNLEKWLGHLKKSEKGKDLQLCNLELLSKDPTTLFPEIIGAEGSAKPLIYSAGRLYTQRLCASESTLIELLPGLLQADLGLEIPANYGAILKEVLSVPKTPHSRQGVAVALAPLKKFFVLSGGPGTGKTTVLVHILRTWLRLDQNRKPEDILLCAPTGKAKARMLESLSKELEDLKKDLGVEFKGVDADLLDHLPKSNTLHQVLWKALNAPLGSPVPKLKQKLIVVDEVSMVDMGLFKLLLESLAPQTQLLLLGDMNQLPSVEHGAVLGDLTEVFAESKTSLSTPTAEKVKSWMSGIELKEQNALDEMVYPKGSILLDHVVHLTYSFRSKKHILNLANLILNFKEGSAWEVQEDPDLMIQPLLDEKNFDQLIQKWYEDELTSYVQELDQNTDFKKEIKELLDKDWFRSCYQKQSISRVLCMQKAGKGGVESANQIGKKWLVGKGAKRKLGTWMQGEPIMMTQNHHALELYNGDCGIIVQTHQGTYAVFKQKEEYRYFMANELQGLESAFALTIHKSQGSEYEHPLILIPFGENALGTKEILYTGVTRAKEKLTLAGDCSAQNLSRISMNRMERPSRLREVLRG